MIGRRKLIGVFILFCCHVLVAFGQQTEDHIVSMFDEPDSVEWVRQMEGTVNDVQEIHMWLGYDGVEYRGSLIILDEQLSFDLVGKMDDGRLLLREIDAQGLQSGYLSGRLGGDRFTGQWWSTDMSRSANVSVVETGLIFLKSFKPNLSVIKGTLGGTEFETILNIESPSMVSGTWQRANECVRMMGQCEDLLCEEISVIVSEGELVGARLTLNTNGKGAYELSFKHGVDVKRGEAKRTYKAAITNRSLAKYAFMVDYTFPVIAKGDFNVWAETQFDDWFDRTQSELVKIDAESPDSRWAHTASGWLDLFLINEEIVSGLMTFFDAEKLEYHRTPFVYSIEESRVLGLNEFGKNDVDLISKIQNEIHVDGVSSSEFKYAVLTESGFFICTDFDAVEGDQSAMVTYDAVGSVLKRKSFLSKLSN